MDVPNGPNNLNQRSRERMSSDVEIMETAYAGEGQTVREEKVFYQCNYCNKDIYRKIHIKCLRCSDFNLCVECFSVAAEVYPHRSNHPYTVMDNLFFPLMCTDWNAKEELLLLEGIKMYGFGNWYEVAEHVGTKDRTQCLDHYNSIYVHSPCVPVQEKYTEHLSMAHRQIIKDVSTKSVCDGNNALAEGAKRAPGVIESNDSHSKSKEGRNHVPIQFDLQRYASNSSKKPKGSRDCNAEGSVREKQARTSVEFVTEYGNDAQQLLADIEFKETDTDDERELKLRVLRFYSKRLDERKCRKKFLLERNLLHPHLFETYLSPEEKEICRPYRVFMRYHSTEEHANLLRTVVEEHRIRKRIQDLKDARAAGCRTPTEVERYIEQKSKRMKESTRAGPC